MKIDKNDPLISRLQGTIHFAVRILAVMMIFVIIMGVVDVGWIIYQRLWEEPRFILTVPDMLASFGAFMAVLIAIEIFINITVYLREDVIHVKIVLATALMAIARKVIILDLDELDPWILVGIGFVFAATALAYWLIHRLPSSEHVS